ncbi:tRNA (adenosine(37)-N6)-dimethylallyltransferase MiaA [Anabaena cylindrica FACHB-243]|uniref:tRNA dimethylallyltransferase n=1 Tax=Anabaena cylindrica (strain ATCC 27899 / PCC 7122) TaxID=272123 RepID=K9ZHV8_ANACC|nr:MULTISPECIES: tRNA (adenosine(37)-N6)-dimethylallyltransferase MiaA [Anabaena]AFZ58152.1 tRNA dimethylallyltransferase [Anabaena cylindrica PCC 7122]MBD2419072.1 tRNA (adenosine(37)-N6)-dimethylallyltransferase MiaA [Anabaena cylindrica FACHB-243]MBY5281220.1 tRNA (adenosine(37)-N6)-dimethylallyltransferase MiaA [Anabaena sp. CCAP 1446/1C]MBY5310289.1 tRNA (adenosine(37)-N6)-dimethylallyltransferase MiaA [Anabaena sp. CCAP 1446/1C]MCM2409542.1 tRNA (adenosine(37)-N6)-dimethylallyltransferas
MTKLIVICGATATGKSGLALSLARRLGSVIVSADSRQVYREFDIGTAKPTVEEQKLVPHYLVDICEPTEIMTLADYQEQVQNLIANLGVSPLLLVGGTGLYIRSIVQGMKIPRVSPQPELRSQLESLGQYQLYPMLQQVDAIAAQKIHANDLVRTLRALEVYYVTGIPISEQQGKNPPKYPILQICLDCDAERLDLRISRRTEQMIVDGLVSEVEYLSQKYGADLPLLNTLGYQEIKQYLAGEVTLDEATELIALHTRQFAKRQRTWFRQSSNLEYFDMDNPDLLELVWERIKEFV